jgi:hypothetical protein
MTGTPDDIDLDRLLMDAQITEEDLMAYADGVLAPDRRLAVRDALAKYPDLMRLLEIFLFTRGPVPAVFNGVLVESTAEKLLAKLKEAEQLRTGTRWKFFGLDPAGLLPLNFKFRAPILVIGAVAAAAVAAWLLGYAVQFVAPDKQGLAASPSLQRALDATPSGKSASLAELLSVEPKLTFFSRLNTWCREYELVYGDNALRQRRLACRDKDGIWRAVGETNAISGKSQYGTADGGDDLERARYDLRVGDVLDVAEEMSVIKKGWKRKR